MNDQERYEDAIHRLALCEYEVFPNGQGYIVRHLTDSDDVSGMRNLNDLVDVADLMEWAGQHRASNNPHKREREG